MALSKEVLEYHKLVSELGQSNWVNAGATSNELSRETISINHTLERAAQDINKACQYSNASTTAIIKTEPCSSAITLGKESLPLIVTTKGGVKSCDANIEEKVRNTLMKMEDNCHRREDLCKSFTQSIDSIEFLLGNFRKLQDVGSVRGEENNLCSLLTASAEISSFVEKDVVASSPINKKN